jgi:hypothetical protein
MHRLSTQTKNRKILETPKLDLNLLKFKLFISDKKTLKNKYI